MKKLYPKEWMKWHPYKETDEVDHYYTGVANKIYKILHDSYIDEGDDFLVDMAFMLTAWFEDVISETHVWETFTGECERRYGSRLPFYKLDGEYYPDEINREDVMFLIWHYMQTDFGGERVINPENPALASAARQIFDMLCDEFEEAPQNERMQEFYGKQTFGPEDFFAYRNKLMWFHLNCYFNLINTYRLSDDMDMLCRESGDDEERIKMISHSLVVNYSFQSRLNLLSLTSAEWLALILKNNGNESGPWDNVEACGDNIYKCVRQDEDFIYAESLCGEKKEYAIKKDSIDLMMLKAFVSGETMFRTMLVKYGGAYWQNGLMQIKDDKDTDEWNTDINELEHTLTHDNQKAVFEDFMKASGGKFFVFVKSREEMKDFLCNKMKYEANPNMILPYVGKDGAMLMASPLTGLHIQMRHVNCICSSDNPFYDKKAAKEKAFMFVVNPDMIPYDLYCVLWDKGMLPDAALKSLNGYKHGRSLLQDNAVFFSDYFYHKCREKDFTDPLLLKWL